jgi:hypothetical protein
MLIEYFQLFEGCFRTYARTPLSTACHVDGGLNTVPLAWTLDVITAAPPVLTGQQRRRRSDATNPIAIRKMTTEAGAFELPHTTVASRTTAAQVSSTPVPA